MNFLKDEEIAIIPPNGYNTDNQSVIAVCWMDWLAKTQGVTIRHAFTGGEVKIDGMKVDGVDEHGVLYEFQGCLFHGCQTCYPNRETLNPITGVTMEELRQKTRLKIDSLRAKGHQVVEKWECVFRKEIEASQELKAFHLAYLPYMPIDPRDPFYGGRVNAIMLFCMPKDGQQLRYVDFTR